MMSERLPSVSRTWIEVLHGVQSALQQTEKEALERENALVRRESPLPALPNSAGSLETRVQCRQDPLGPVKEEVRHADLELEAAENDLEKWRKRLQSLSQDLATWAVRSIK
ncbi:MAG TPA: hypothetical protein VGY58_00620 [Gemmataceae bacterium]|jgi:chromosome segregation ATPase|nr:hypothetical protein [Gemmataceae bacterium]